MAEWFKAAVLKTVDGETRPGVRIPLPPPAIKFESGRPSALLKPSSRFRSQRGFNASATKKMTEPPIAAIQKKSISKASLKSDGRFYTPIFRIFGTLENRGGAEATGNRDAGENKPVAIKTLFRRMDAEIERLLFGFETDPQTEISQRGGMLPRYTSDAFAADEIVRRIKADGGDVFITERNRITECFLLTPVAYDGWADVEIRAASAPLAIAIATLKAAGKVISLCDSTYVQLREIEELEAY